MTPSPTDLDGTRVLVTGGAGFIGSHLVGSLVADADVRVLDDLSVGDRSRLPAGAALHVGDVRDAGVLAEAMAGVDVVFHEAALVSVERSIETPRQSHSINVEGTLAVLEAAREAGARVVVASSAAVYGRPASVPVGESAPLRPTSPYGADKLAADAYARLYADCFDLPTVVLRYFNVYGPGATGGDYAGVIEAFAARARAGEPLVVHGDGSQTRDFVHVSDVVRANRLAATTDAVGEAFNVGTGRSVSIRRLAELVRAASGADSRIVHDDPRPGDVDRSRADVGKARDGLGYEAEVSIEAGLESLLAGEDLSAGG